MCIQLAERASDILWINEERRPLASKMYAHAEFVWQEKYKLKVEFDEMVENSLISILFFTIFEVIYFLTKQKGVFISDYYSLNFLSTCLNCSKHILCYCLAISTYHYTENLQPTFLSKEKMAFKVAIFLTCLVFGEYLFVSISILFCFTFNFY